MKKVLVFLLLLAVAGGLFAQFTIGGRVDAYWIPFQFVDRDGDTMMGAGVGRDDNGGVGPRAQLLGKANNEDNTMGIRIDLQFRTVTNAFAFGDYVDAWWKINDMFYVDVGKFVDSTFRGKVGDFWFRKFTVGSYGADAIFSRFNSAGQNIGTAGSVGILGIFTLGDLKVGVALPGLETFAKSAGQLSGIGLGGGAGQSTNHEAADMTDGSGDLRRAYEKVHAVVGYTIPDIGMVRAGYVGASPNPNGDTPTGVIGQRVELAFALTAVEGLTVDVGAKYPFPINEYNIKGWNKTDVKWDSEYYSSTTTTTGANAGPDGLDGNKDDVKGTTTTTYSPYPTGSYHNPIQLALGAVYKITDALTFNGRVDYNFLASKDVDLGETKYGMELNAHIWPQYNLGFMTVGLDFGVAWKANDKFTPVGGDEVEQKNGGIMLGGGLFASKAWGGCTLQGGLAYRVATKIGETAAGDDIKADSIFTIPVTFAWNF